MVSCKLNNVFSQSKRLTFAKLDPCCTSAAHRGTPLHNGCGLSLAHTYAAAGAQTALIAIDSVEVLEWAAP